MAKNKATARVHTKQGMPIKVWANSRTGVVLPSNWKQQAGFMAGEVTITKRLANRHKRKAEARAKWRSWSNIPNVLAMHGVRQAVA